MQRISYKVLWVLIQAWMFRADANGQGLDSLKTAYLMDPAEEFWPLSNNKAENNKDYRFKHIPVNQSKGFISMGLSFREVYEYYDNYLWGIGVQDINGYFLHRFLLYSDIRWNAHFSVFTQIESSTITGRAGGPRPVQDLNKLAVVQLFGEQSLLPQKNVQLKLRIGKQSLHYSMGTLLDIRDANVRLSWMGGKLIFENSAVKLDAFFMQPIKEAEGLFDDKINKSQKLAGIWGTAKYLKSTFNQLDFYYLFNKRDYTTFYQGAGREMRHTVGMLCSFKWKNWGAYTVTDLQVGKFNNAKINAWKIAALLKYEIVTAGIKPILSIQGAISSGDRNAADASLQTFNPLYPSGVYYGYLNSVGSANMIVLHPKAECKFSGKFYIKTSYYQFWRQQSADGIYSGSGSYLLPAANNDGSVGRMWDMEINCGIGEHISMQLIGSYFSRGKYLEKQPDSYYDIFYVAAKTTICL